MTSVDAFIYIFIGILGVAYPILLQVVARLDEKYSSDKITELFDKETVKKQFEFTLYITFLLLVVWSLKLAPLFQIEGYDYYIENSASIFLSISTVLLVVVFILFVRKIMIYYNPTKVIQYLKDCNDKSEMKLDYFVALSELLLLYIRQQKVNYTKTLSEFFYLSFRKIRQEQSNQRVVYPDHYYDIVTKAVEELAILKEKRNYFIEHEIWLLGKEQGCEISDKTYRQMWQNINLAVRYQQDDLIVHHWETCHQYYEYNLPYISPKYDSSDSELQVSNEDAVGKRKTERQQFIEFHYTLGGLLLYKERYSCINRLFGYTQNNPPKYELLPDSMDTIFKFYFKLSNFYNRSFENISYVYPFPELSGQNANFIVKKWIMSYMAILFLRQYTIEPYLTTMRPFEFPSVPSTQGEIKHWIDNLDFFEILVSMHLKNIALLKVLNIDFISQKWCDRNGKIFPVTFIHNFKKILEKAYTINARNLPLSATKVSKFNISTTSIIEQTFNKLQLVNNTIRIDENSSDRWYVNGSKDVISKDAFSDAPEVSFLDYDTYQATGIADNLINCLSQGFLIKTTKSYLLKSEDIFKAIDKLNINEDFIIVNFGVDLNSCYNLLKRADPLSDNYNSARIVSFEGTRLTNGAVFILKKCDLPNISSLEIPNEILKDYSLTPTESVLKLYPTVVDLNEIPSSSKIFIENRQGYTEDQMRKSALIFIFLSIEFKWKKTFEMVKLNVYYEYLQKGIINKVDDVKNF